MSTEKTSFKSDAEIRSSFKPRYKVQHPKSGTRNLGKYDYNTITDEWFNWYHTTPHQDNVFLSHITKPPIYFVEGLPLESPHFNRVTIKEPASLLVPIYSFSASQEEYPSLNEPELLKLMKKDISGIDWTSVKATLDGKPMPLYSVMRAKPLTINNIPPNNPIDVGGNTIHVYHGGFWLLIEPHDLPPGDHLLHLKANSKTYEMEAKILINATY
jgi:hypothetical protein